MNQKVYHTLEYYKILDRLADYASCEEAKDRCHKLVPLTDPAEIAHLQETTADALSRLYRGSGISFSGVHNVNASLKRLDIGGTLNTTELLMICSLLEVAKRVKAYDRSDRNDEKTDSLSPLFSQIQPLSPLLDEIRRCVVGEDEIADDASAALSKTRKSIRGMNDRIHAQLTGLMNNTTTRSYLQDAVITMRDGRYCLPVRAESKTSVPGMVHDQSSSGSTLFIEPMAVVNLNNELKELFLKEQEEIDRILADLSNRVAENANGIRQDYTVLAELDFIFARAQLSYAMNAGRPLVRKRGGIDLKKARHPLLDQARAVPVTVELGGRFDTLVITGPNTGGKTVTLKTLGLLTLMTQCGLHIPAADRSAVSVYERVLADIGDEQSIEQSLSTFSAHMVNIVEILKEADRHSLVLFDELGAGTDPVEGAALAIAVIQHVRRLGAKVAATTHYAELKTFAMTTAGVENASCEFDVETLAPTYRLLIGIPGKSNAFAISRRLGLPEDVIAAAQEQMSGESVRFEDILTQLEEKRQALEKREQEADRLLRQREEDARRAREFREQMERAKENARSRGEAEAKRILRDARTAADQVFQELSEMRKAQAKAERMLNENEARAALRRTLNEAEEAVSRRDARQEPIPKPSRPIRAGDLVEIPGVKTPAEVVSVGKDGTLQLKAGILKMKAKVDEVRLIEDDERAARKKAPSVTIRQNADRALRASAARELDIRGMETLEAESVVENFISAAVMGKLETVTIIHGKGTGALRKAVHDILRRNKAVKSFRLGVYGEGESGVTVVTLK